MAPFSLARCLLADNASPLVLLGKDSLSRCYQLPAAEGDVSGGGGPAAADLELISALTASDVTVSAPPADSSMLLPAGQPRPSLPKLAS